MAARVRAFLGVGGVASFHRLARVVAGVGDSDAVRGGEDEVIARLRAAGGEWSERDLGEFCRVVSAISARTLGQRPFPGQLVTALALLGGHGVQLSTGEGKTLAGAIAAIAFALCGRRVHVVSVNDYLARRDAEAFAPLFDAFDVSVGWVASAHPAPRRRDAYDADVVYVSAAELGFDVLRDRFRVEAVPGPLVRPDVAIVDEVDAVLIDEASMPLVLAAATTGTETTRDADDDAARTATVVGLLREVEHFVIDADRLNVSLTDRGTTAVEEALGIENLFDSRAHDHLTAVNLALHARALVHRDIDYLVRDGRLQLISGARGRIATTQRWPDGLQEAIEVKEGIGTGRTSEVLDSITVRALMKLHRTVCGMSGTALAVAPLLADGYGFTTGAVASRVPSRRIDHPDRIFRTGVEKRAALLERIRSEHAVGRPVLVGTASVAASEELAAELRASGTDVVVLNAKNDADEAAIIARAGEFGRVTVSTQMAGRGTDIRLGGPDEGDRARVVTLGGLAVIGAERHANGRLDDQLRGRAGRQGDPGSSVFFAALDDVVVVTQLDLVADGRAASGGHGGLDRAAGLVDHAQRVGEAAREQVRASTLRFAEAPARQRAAVLRLREEILERGLSEAPQGAVLVTPETAVHLASLTAGFGARAADRFATRVALFHLDEAWCAHAAMLEAAREGIHLRSLARDDPLDVYTRIAQREFDGFVPAVATAIAETVRDAAESRAITDDPPRFLRPGVTWTYMVTEDPFGSPEKRLWRRATASLRRFLR